MIMMLNSVQMTMMNIQELVAPPTIIFLQVNILMKEAMRKIKRTKGLLFQEEQTPVLVEPFQQVKPIILGVEAKAAS